MASITRRDLITALACSGASLTPAIAAAKQNTPRRSTGSRPPTYLDILRQPDSADAFFGLEERVRLDRAGARWEGQGFVVRPEITAGDVRSCSACGASR